MALRALVMAAVVLTGTVAAPVEAADFFRLFGDSNGDGFTLPSGASPSVFSEDDFWFYDVPVTVGQNGSGGGAGKVSLQDLHFRASAAGGGFSRQEAGSLTGLLDYSGPVLFDGPTSAPIFRLGTYSLTGPGGSGSYELTISAVPEPASWAMLIAGFGLTGAAMRRRRVATA